MPMGTFQKPDRAKRTPNPGTAVDSPPRSPERCHGQNGLLFVHSSGVESGAELPPHTILREYQPIRDWTGHTASPILDPGRFIPTIIR